MRAFTCFLSAKFRLSDARTVLPHCDRVPTDADAERLVAGGTVACCENTKVCAPPPFACDEPGLGLTDILDNMDGSGRRSRHRETTAHA